MFTIDRSSWHTKVYLWWYANKYEGGNQTFKVRTKTTSNLCPYMRAVLIWAPLRAIFWDWIKLVNPEGTPFYLPFNAVTIPTLMYLIPVLGGYVSYKFKHGIFDFYQFLLFAVGLVAGLAAVVIPLVLFIKYLIEQDKKKPKKPKKEKKPSTFVPLVQEYLRSGHDRICPELNFPSEEAQQLLEEKAKADAAVYERERDLGYYE